MTGHVIAWSYCEVIAHISHISSKREWTAKCKVYDLHHKQNSAGNYSLAFELEIIQVTHNNNLSTNSPETTPCACEDTPCSTLDSASITEVTHTTLHL